MSAIWIEHLQGDSLLIALIAISSLGTWVSGAAPERLSMLVITGGWLTERVVGELAGDAATGATLEQRLGIATLGGLAMTGIAVRANRIYTLVIATLQTFVIASYAANLIDPHVPSRLVRMIEAYATHAQLAVLVVGTWLHARRVRYAGPYPSWVRRPHAPRHQGRPPD